MMPLTFAADALTACIVGALAAAGGAALLILEWRRPDARRRAGRIGAVLLAATALAWLALRPARLVPVGAAGAPRTPKVGALWTDTHNGGLPPAPTDIPAERRFALSDAALPTGVTAERMPDLATLRRRHPEIGTWRILGDGLDDFELEALEGQCVEFAPPAPRAGTDARGAAVDFLRCPRTLPLGDALTIQGRVGGLPAGRTAELTLVAPDGRSTGAATARAGADGEAGFTVRSPAPGAAGSFVWRMQLREAGQGPDAAPLEDDPLGVEVVAPTLPRVLVLASAPRFDLTALRRWYEGIGGIMRARIHLGQDRSRTFATAGADGVGDPEAGPIDGALLVGCDVLVADAHALAALPAPERATLRTAVEQGLGVLELADDAVLPPATVAPDRMWLLPWLMRPLEPGNDSSSTPATAATGGPAEGVERSARLSWPEHRKPLDTPIPAAPFEIVPRPDQLTLVSDDQGRALAALASLGRGKLALTLVRQTGRWERGDDPGAFAAYWSWVLGQVARPIEAPTRWTLPGADDGPLLVDQPVELLWTQPPEAPPPRALRVRDESDVPPVTLAPLEDREFPGLWHAVYWPRRAGWQRLENASAPAPASGARLDLYVHPVESWRALVAARRSDATARVAFRSAAPVRPVAATDLTPRELRELPASWAFALFLCAAGWLWIEQRFAAG